MKKQSNLLVTKERIMRAIIVVRGCRAILDADVASLYGVETRALIQAVKRNADRFPPDFMFAVTPAEMRALKAQGLASSAWGGRRSAPFAFTEHGVAMLSSVLRSERATMVNIEIMRAFVGLREALATHAALVRKIDTLEQKFDGQFRVVFDAIRGLMKPQKRTRKQIGFVPAKKK